MKDLRLPYTIDVLAKIRQDCYLSNHGAVSANKNKNKVEVGL